MSQPNRESHLRSLLKGISWRVFATLDTILIVSLVTWVVNGTPSIGDAVKVGAWEFLLKFIAYYLHERVWERLRTGDGLDKSRTIKKSISWRLIATAMTFVVAGAILDFGTVAIAVTIIEFPTKLGLYYLHERLWLRLPLGRVRNWVRRVLGKM